MSTATVLEPLAEEPAPRPTKGRRRNRAGSWGGGNVLVYLIALVVVLITLGPVLYGVMSGFRTNADIADNPSGLPRHWVLMNYKHVLAGSAFWNYALNSMVIALLTTAVTVALGIMAAYPLARYQFRGREALFIVFVLGLLFPAAVAIIPLFIILTRNFHMTNTWWGVALPQAAFALPMTVVILRPFLMALPTELEEAATIDGAGRIGVFLRIIVPLSMPGMITVGVLAFVTSWNAYLLPLLLLTGDMQTLPQGVASYSGEHSADIAGVFAFTTISMIPALVLFLALQRRIVSGLQGAVKG